MIIVVPSKLVSYDTFKQHSMSAPCSLLISSLFTPRLGSKLFEPCERWISLYGQHKNRGQNPSKFYKCLPDVVKCLCLF